MENTATFTATPSPTISIAQLLEIEAKISRPSKWAFVLTEQEIRSLKALAPSRLPMERFAFEGLPVHSVATPLDMGRCVRKLLADGFRVLTTSGEVTIRDMVPKLPEFFTNTPILPSGGLA